MTRLRDEEPSEDVEEDPRRSQDREDHEPDSEQEWVETCEVGEAPSDPAYEPSIGTPLQRAWCRLSCVVVHDSIVPGGAPTIYGWNP